jgi:hypothetical protein
VPPFVLFTLRGGLRMRGTLIPLDPLNPSRVIFAAGAAENAAGLVLGGRGREASRIYRGGFRDSWA